MFQTLKIYFFFLLSTRLFLFGPRTNRLGQQQFNANCQDSNDLLGSDTVYPSFLKR